MPENTVDAVKVEEPQDQAPSFEPITSQEDLDKIIQKRVLRERNKYADYEVLAEKAAKFDDAVESNKSELQKALDRAAEAEQALADRERETARYQVIAEFNLPADLHELVTGGDVEAMRVQAEKLSELVKPGVNLHQVVSTDGKRPDRKPRSTAQAFAEAIEGRI